MVVTNETVASTMGNVCTDWCYRSTCMGDQDRMDVWSQMKPLNDPSRGI